MRTALVAAAAVATALMAAAPAADAAPVHQDGVVCFVHAIEPYKATAASIGAISFGFTIHCTGRPSWRTVTTKLWRFDLHDGRYYVHSERDDTSTEPDLETLYSASCTDAGILYQFHTEVVVNGFHGNWDHHSDNSDVVPLLC